MTTLTTERPAATLDAARLDGYVERAEAAAFAFRQLSQEAVDRIVRAMVVAGVRHAIELARLAIDETGFGVFEDKVIKNLMATETLYDYLEDKRTVGVIFEDPDNAIVQIADPIGVVLALLPITNPTSTALSKAIIAAKTRNAVIFRPAARAVRCAKRTIEILQAAGQAAGLPADAFQVTDDPTREASQYLFQHGGVDLIWTTGGQKAVQAASKAGKPCIGVGAGNAPVYLHRSADLRMAVMDILLSKTFDASVICAAEQTLVVDDLIYDDAVAELERMGARMLGAHESEALAMRVLAGDGQDGPRRWGSRARTSSRWRAWTRTATTTRRFCSLRCRPISWLSRSIRLCTRSRCRCSGSCARRASRTRSPSASWSPSRVGWAIARPSTARRGRHLRLRRGDADKSHRRQRPKCGRCAGRRLHGARPDALAGLRVVGRLEHDGQRQLS